MRSPMFVETKAIETVVEQALDMFDAFAAISPAAGDGWVANIVK
jgi:hypothetical protein